MQRNGIEVLAPVTAEFKTILTREALHFVENLSHQFEPRRLQLLEKRSEIQKKIDSGWLPDFLKETEKIRKSDWKIAPTPKDLQDRRVEITGPVDRKMIINALNSGAKVFMADFEDSNSPTWNNNIQGQINLRDAVNKTITYVSPEGKEYKLNDTIATLLVRPRGWHLVEKHVKLDGKPISGSLFDFGLYFFHNAKTLLEKGTGPYFYLPKLESHLETRLWNDVFIFAQKELGIPNGTIKVTVLIETILAAFEMDEILYELKDHIVGLNCGRWDYIFSFIKKFKNNPQFVLPDRAQVTMDKAFLKAYVDLLVQTCHKRGAHAMGGMAAQIPIKNDPQANEEAINKVIADKKREVAAGHDGTWVAHPGLVPIATKIFDEEMKGPNQLSISREEVKVTANDLLKVPLGEITEKGLRTNINVGILYLEAWLRGSGCVPLYNLMEDAATAEISRAQVWQWTKHGTKMTDGRKVTKELVRQTIKEEMVKFKTNGKVALASELFDQMMTSDQFSDFLTLVAYDYLEN
ncbi:MAG: malate synthase A [Deltaproteobacteria bacterium RIFCSPLOWO2_12_FULL_44_12]|nr:MAG: malate synthase A [Deltaproteobacteria bacterium RIFCSPHIGHO2_01_FULL_43_49]OGQ14370.1 MAG: malate synthase A [Deltaproteobacteria bacterium RIFCSPHIGHO2_02_FULL_44_53]OGQ27590.1 MAG: malate synthase A [Deltaproteobacteria bacterium RIFCSPHIGHO2_12_FULL_44_21]OGQ30811.1 MAG: malate synthase A [Deltaproteobacteria bacterium RIFCSPLOWO2_01_FULL_45_74]OGQ42492.1 MAG: malate synthase A [Deltaproteobacteria bacterium RIFCSPLOWO2_02_FULL_44_34]OGQ69312.1 MAG: malate synthase A [Deltaproteoba